VPGEAEAVLRLASDQLPSRQLLSSKQRSHRAQKTRDQSRDEAEAVEEVKADGPLKIEQSTAANSEASSLLINNTPA